MKTIQEWLSAAARWRWASLLFQSPTPATVEDLRAIADELPDEYRDRARLLSAVSVDVLEEEFHRVLGPAGCPACESSYDDNVLAGRGPLLAEIAGFYEAFAYRIEPDARETPDHLSVELGFLSFLAFKVAFAISEETPPEREIAEAAYWQFLEAHPLYWWDRFCEKVAGTGSDFYVAAITVVDDWVHQPQLQSC